jgi:hypothetical protein
MDASGQLGGAIVFSKWKGRNYVRQYVIPSNPNTDGQIAVRARMKFLAQIWASVAAPAQASWDAAAAAGQYSAFNAFSKANSRLIGEGNAPSADIAHDEGDTSPTLGAQSATGGVGLVTISQAMTVIAGGWAFLLYRSLTNAFTPAPSNVVAIIPFNGATTVVYDDTGLAPATYYYKIAAFTVEGKLSTAGAQMTGVVT